MLLKPVIGIGFMDKHLKFHLETTCLAKILGRGERSGGVFSHIVCSSHYRCENLETLVSNDHVIEEISRYGGGM